MSKPQSNDVAILGGGEREREIARMFIEKGFGVRVYGTVDMGSLNIHASNTVEEAVNGVAAIVCPMPGLDETGALFAPHADRPIRLNEETLRLAEEGALIFLGRDTTDLSAVAQETGVNIREMGDDDVLQVAHAIPTAEAAVALAIDNLDEALVNSKIGITGYGRIGQLLAQYLRGFGAEVKVAARRLESRVRAEALGMRSCNTDTTGLVELVSDTDVLFLTASAVLVDSEVAAHAPEGLLVIDLVSPPGGADHDSLESAGARVIWARAQADKAAGHSARAQFEHIYREFQA